MSGRHNKRSLDVVRTELRHKIKMRDAYDYVMADMKERGHDVRDISYHAMEHCRVDLAAEIQRLRDMIAALEAP